MVLCEVGGEVPTIVLEVILKEVFVQKFFAYVIKGCSLKGKGFLSTF